MLDARIIRNTVLYQDYINRKTCIYQHRFSQIDTFIEREKTKWKQFEKAHPKQSEYTTLYFYVQLNGMRLHSLPSYPSGYADDPDSWVGFAASASATVSDSGILVEASCPLFELKRTRPVTQDKVYAQFLEKIELSGTTSILPGENWKEALLYALNHPLHAALYKSSADQLFQNQYMTEPVIPYGSKTVITEIQPILHTISENEWAPFWCIEVKSEFSDGWRY